MTLELILCASGDSAVAFITPIATIVVEITAPIIRNTFPALTLELVLGAEVLDAIRFVAIVWEVKVDTK